MRGLIPACLVILGLCVVGAYMLANKRRLDEKERARTAGFAKSSAYMRLRNESESFARLVEPIVDRNDKEALIKLLRKAHAASRQAAFSMNVFKGQPNLVKAMIDGGYVRKGEINELDRVYSIDKREVLEMGFETAIRWGYADIVGTLLDRGVDANMRLGGGWPAVAQAAAWGHTDVVNKLLDAGARIDVAIDWASGPPPIIRPGDMERRRIGMTPLMLAAQNGHAETVMLLIGRGASVRKKWVTGETALDVVLRRRWEAATSIQSRVTTTQSMFPSVQTPARAEAISKRIAKQVDWLKVEKILQAAQKKELHQAASH